MPGQKVGPRSSRACLVKLTEAEHASIAETARAVGLPVAGLIRRLALGYEPESIVDSRTLLELIRLRSDLGRLGGVMKMWLVTGPAAAHRRPTCARPLTRCSTVRATWPR